MVIQQWGAAKISNLNIFLSFQSINLRLIIKTPQYVSNHTIQFTQRPQEDTTPVCVVSVLQNVRHVKTVLRRKKLMITVIS